MVLGDVGGMVAGAVVIGALLSLAVTRLLPAILYGVAPNDRATLTWPAVMLVTVAIAIAAAVAPARRAARRQPVAALRED